MVAGPPTELADVGSAEAHWDSPCDEHPFTGAQHVEVGGVHLLGAQAEDIRAELRAERPFVEDETDVEGLLHGVFDRGDLPVAKTLGAKSAVRERIRTFERAAPDRIAHDVFDFIGRIAKRL